jgi:hypothetical protein
MDFLIGPLVLVLLLTWRGGITARKINKMYQGNGNIFTFYATIVGWLLLLPVRIFFYQNAVSTNLLDFDFL